MMDFICAIPVLSGLLAPCTPPVPMAAGYIEGEYVLIAPVETARLAEVRVRRGDHIAAGQPLAVMEKRDSEIAVAQARAALAQAESQLANISEGRRPEEIAVIEASLNSARAQAEEAERDVQRQTDLLKRGIAAQASYDNAATALKIANAKVAELEANLAVARLPARAHEIRAAESAVAQARAALENAEWRLSNRTLSSPRPATVFDIIRNPGEVAGPQAPVLTVLPEGAVKLRLYVPQSVLSSVHVGTKLSVNCDGCASGLTATVSYVATDPEFTPPVIYSLENRQKLVFLVEARPDNGISDLKPGQIVDVVLPGAAQ